MTGRTTVFLGPSLPEATARQILPAARCLPPARRGDLDAIDPELCDEVLLIDGVMVYEHPPSPTEVHSLAQRGVRVVGAASLGALRAVELRNHGVEGIGWVFEEYLARRATADDEVLARLDPRTDLPTTIFMINVRYAVTQLQTRELLTRPQANTFLAAVSLMHFEDRTRAAVNEAALAAGISEPVISMLGEPAFDVKARDAMACLRQSRSHRAGPAGAP